MNKHRKQIKLRRFGHVFAVTIRTALFSALALIGGLGLPSRVYAAQTSVQYCNQYTSNGKVNACKDGIRGQDCSDYAITFDEETANICRKATQAKQNGQISDLPAVNTGNNDPEDPCSDYNGTLQEACKRGVDTGTCNSNLYVTNPQAYQACQAGVASTADSFDGSNVGSITAPPSSIQDLLDQQQTLSKYIDVLHGAGPDAGVDTSKEPDDNPNSYVNGAGKQQPIKVTPCAGSGATAQATSQTQSVVRDATGNRLGSVTSTTTTGGCPAIIFINGGGWHGNDGVSNCVAAGTPGNKPDCMSGSDGSGEGSPPAGGGATERGFTSIDLSHRYGSSGIYYMYEDVMRGIQHVINNAGMYGIDTNKIALWGDSSGGSLALRAAASGMTGAKVVVGWSAPTNAFTGLFKSYKSLMIGMDHSTCIPTDLAGLTNTTDLMNGGSGAVAEYGQGLSSNDFSSLGIGAGGGGGGGLGGLGGGEGGGNPLGMLTEVLTAAQNAAATSQNVEAITQQMTSSAGAGGGAGGGASPLSLDSITGGGGGGLTGGVMNLSSKKLIECIDNFNVMSPALFASPESPPAFLAGFSTDDVIDQQQAYDMRDKLRSLGIESEALILPGDPNGQQNALGPIGGNHLGYDAQFVCQSINFIEHIITPEKDADQIDCATGQRPSEQSAPPADNAGGGGGGGGDSSGSGAGGAGNGSGTGANQGNSGEEWPECPKGTLPAGGTQDASGKFTPKCMPDKPRNTTPAEQPRPNCTGDSFYSTTHKSCIYHTDHTNFDTDNQWGRSHGCGSARYIGQEANGDAICGVGANAF